jgi:hypothetical protein
MAGQARGRSGRRSKRRPPPRPEPPQAPERPRPPERGRSLWRVFGILCAVLAAAAWARMGPGGATLAYRGDFAYYPEPADSSVAVTPPFELNGRTSSVEVGVTTDLDNAWVYFNYALIEEKTGRAVEFVREVGFYHGSYTEERYSAADRRTPSYTRETYWVEGSREDAVRVPAVPAGRYVLRIAPEGPTPVRYGVRVRRDAPAWEFYALALLLLLAPPAFASLGRTRLSLISIAGGKRPRR